MIRKEVCAYLAQMQFFQVFSIHGWLNPGMWNPRIWKASCNDNSTQVTKHVILMWGSNEIMYPLAQTQSSVQAFNLVMTTILSSNQNQARLAMRPKAKFFCNNDNKYHFRHIKCFLLTLSSCFILLPPHEAGKTKIIFPVSKQRNWGTDNFPWCIQALRSSPRLG
jgi:hypothetical protein